MRDATRFHFRADRGKPQTIRVDNGPEFVSQSLDLWAYFNGVQLDFSRPEKLADNAAEPALVLVAR